MSADLWREVPTSIGKVNDVPRESRVALFCAQAGVTWNLQVRGPFRRYGGSGREGKDFIVATAAMSTEDLLVLRKSIDGLLGDAGKIP